MPLPQHEDYTTEDIYHLPEGTRAELIDGQIYYMAPPTRTHQKLPFQSVVPLPIISIQKKESVRLILLHLQYFWMKITEIM